MQVVILCGGQGTRIRDVAADVPKPMIPIGDRPILWHIMAGFARHGLTRFVLCLGHQSWVIKRYFLDYHLAASDFSLRLGAPADVDLHSHAGGEDWHVTLAETGADAMTGCRVKRIEKYVTGDDFILTYGDGVADVDVTRLIRFHRDHGRTATVTAVRAPGRFGEMDLDGPRVAQFDEKPALSPGRINGGFFVFRRDMFDRLVDDPRLVLESDVLAPLARDGELMAYRHDGFWHPMDNSRDYRHLNDMWARGECPWLAPVAPIRAAA
jgi:glucose-1-phosphate cytidylyltransferase